MLFTFNHQKTTEFSGILTTDGKHDKTVSSPSAVDRQKPLEKTFKTKRPTAGAVAWQGRMRDRENTTPKRA
jgi:hypothetical protein